MDGPGHGDGQEGRVDRAAVVADDDRALVGRNEEGAVDFRSPQDPHEQVIQGVEERLCRRKRRAPQHHYNPTNQSSGKCCRYAKSKNIRHFDR